MKLLNSIGPNIESQGQPQNNWAPVAIWTLDCYPLHQRAQLVFHLVAQFGYKSDMEDHVKSLTWGWCQNCALLIQDPVVSLQKEQGWSGMTSPWKTHSECSKSPSCPSSIWKYFPERFAPCPSQGLRWGWVACSSPDQLLLSRAELKVIHYPLSAKFSYTETFLPFPLLWAELLGSHTRCVERGVGSKVTWW